MATSEPPATTDPLLVWRDQLVSAQWAQVDALERLDPVIADRALARTLAAEALAAHKLTPLRYWPLLPRQNYEVYVLPPSRVRLRHVLAYVRPGERVLDVGSGYGYVAGTLLREERQVRYTGIDVGVHLLQGVRQMAEINGLAQCDFTLDNRSVFALDAAFMNVCRPSLIFLLEVLEHLPNPEEALAALADCMPEEAEVLFSVPLAGRQDFCWEHQSLFDVHRLRRMCEAAGLTVQYVEPVFNTWNFVLASRHTVPAERIAHLPVPVAPDDPGPAPWEEPLRPVDLAALTVQPSKRWALRTTSRVPSVDADGIHCAVIGQAQGDSQYGGIQFPLTGPGALRFDLTLHNPQDTLGVYVDGHNAEGARVLRWQWAVGEGQVPSERRTTYVLRARLPTGPFQPVGPTRPAEVTELEVFLRIRRGTTCGFTLHRLDAAQRRGQPASSVS